MQHTLYTSRWSGRNDSRKAQRHLARFGPTSGLKPKAATKKLYRQVLPLVLVLSLGANLLQLTLYAPHAEQGQGDQANLQQTDVPFLQHMLVHHRQAALMADLTVDRLQGRAQWLAKSIVAKQSEEIGVMRGLLASWGQNAVPLQINMDWMRPHATPEQLIFIDRCLTAPGGMEGLASQQQLHGLMEQTEPEQLGQRFALLMTKHHQAALPMLEYARSFSASPQVRIQAGAMLADQRKELIELQNLLEH